MQLCLMTRGIQRVTAGGLLSNKEAESHTHTKAAQPGGCRGGCVTLSRSV